MHLSHLHFAPTNVLAASQALYRIQRNRAHRGTVRIGPLRLPPADLLSGRFDLAGTSVGYFAEAPETAVYEALARREAQNLSMAALRQRTLLCVQTKAPLQLLDLRPHASTFPVLQSMRFAQTQELAAEIAAIGHDGIVYRSAQQFGMDCYAIFGHALRELAASWSEALVEPATGNLHNVVVTCLLGSGLSLTY